MGQMMFKRLSTRLINFLMIMVIIALFITLFVLEPSASGIGTHRQLVPVPCLFHLALGIPCPSCGLTTSLSFLMHGEWKAALRAHPLGLVAFLAMMLIFLASLYGVILNRSWWRVTEKRWFQNIILCGIGFYLTAWIIKMISNLERIPL